MRDSFNALIDFNRYTRKYKDKKENQKMIAQIIRKGYSPDLHVMLPLYMIDVISETSFNYRELYDWKSYFLYCQKININIVECLEPYARVNIRKHNKAKAKERLDGSLDKLNKFIEELGSPGELYGDKELDLILFFFEIGIVKPSLHFDSIFSFLNKLNIG